VSLAVGVNKQLGFLREKNSVCKSLVGLTQKLPVLDDLVFGAVSGLSRVCDVVANPQRSDLSSVPVDYSSWRSNLWSSLT
jgi:hypothetical protein